MKKMIVAAVVTALLCVGVALAGTKCWKCSGTGWDGRFKCSTCGGDGEIGN